MKEEIELTILAGSSDKQLILHNTVYVENISKPIESVFVNIKR